MFVPPYVELNCKSNFSFLEGASHPHEIVETAKQLHYAGVAITDRNSLAGVVRGHTAAKDCQIPFIVGTELHFVDGPGLLVWPKNRKGYGSLCKLLSLGRQRAQKGECILSWGDLGDYLADCLGAVLPRLNPFARDSQLVTLSDHDGSFKHLEPDLVTGPWFNWLPLAKELLADDVYIAISLLRGVDDRAWLDQLSVISNHSGVPLVATGDVLYHSPERMLLQDCVTAIGAGVTIDEIASFRPDNSQRHLRSLAEISSLYRGAEHAINNTVEIANRIDFSLDQLRYEYPTEWAPEGMTPIEYLKRLAWAGAKQRYPDGVPEKIISMLRYELKII
ncbi:MAG: PHP domain-containing protein, partial [Pirellula sp.]|nr:PHP domain-containing protein [Pirellula sp.]